MPFLRRGREKEMLLEECCPALGKGRGDMKGKEKKGRNVKSMHVARHSLSHKHSATSK